MADAEEENNKAKENDLNKKESEIVAEFCNLLEQSRQLFKSLRWIYECLCLEITLYVLVFVYNIR